LDDIVSKMVSQKNNFLEDLYRIHSHIYLFEFVINGIILIFRKNLTNFQLDLEKDLEFENRVLFKLNTCLSYNIFILLDMKEQRGRVIKLKPGQKTLLSFIKRLIKPVPVPHSPKYFTSIK